MNGQPSPKPGTAGVVVKYVGDDNATHEMQVEFPELLTNHNAWQRATIEVWASLNANLFAIARMLVPEPDQETAAMQNLRAMAQAEHDKLIRSTREALGKKSPV